MFTTFDKDQACRQCFQVTGRMSPKDLKYNFKGFNLRWVGDRPEIGGCMIGFPWLSTVTPPLSGLSHVRQKSGKNKFFSRSGNCKGFLKKCQGILSSWHMSGNFQGILLWQLNFVSRNYQPSFACILFEVLKIFLGLTLLGIHSQYAFFKMFHYFYDIIMICVLLSTLTAFKQTHLT